LGFPEKGQLSTHSRHQPYFLQQKNSLQLLMTKTESASWNEFSEAWFVTVLPSDGLPESFGIVTAFNPDSCKVSKAKNNSADTKLRHHLEKAGLQYFRVTGRSQDGSHQEPGFGIVATSPEEIRPLGCQFKQEAFFWVENGTISLCKTATECRKVIALWTERQILSI
jgi:hypothetical protein